MTDIIHTFAADTAELESKREISGLAAPYGEVITHNGRKVRFEKGMFAGVEEAQLHYNHEGLPIGKIVQFEDTDEGLKIKARISKTERGEEVYTLLRDGVINKFSVGFIGLQQRQDDDVSVWTKVGLHEISVVPRPAFKSAAITEVHSEADTTKEMEIDEFTMSEEIVNKVAELEESYADLSRKVVLLGTQDTAEVKNNFANGGEALKALATGDDAAKQEFAFTGATTADSLAGPAWINRGLKLVDEKRNILNLFDRAALPAAGNSIEYPVVSGTSGTVGEQLAEGDDLPYMEVTIDTATAPVKTYGGYSSRSRQAIERSDVAYLQTVLDYQARQYAKVTNAAVRAALVGATGVNTCTALGADAAEDWIDLVVDSVALIDDNSKGSQAQFVLVSRGTFKRLAHMVDSTGRPVFALNGDGSNTIGDFNVRGVRGNIAGLPVIVDPALADTHAYVASSDAIVSYESSGAPFRLQDENVINLTKEFSLYGYMAVAVHNPLATVKIDTDLVA